MTERSIAVCIIIENLPVPFDRRVWQEACALRDAGYRVSIICPKGRGFEQGRETFGEIEIYRHRIWEASGPAGYLIEYPWALCAEFFLALRIYAHTRFRILHACNPPDTIFLIGLFFKLFGVRFIFDHHDLNPELYLAKFGRKDFLYRLVCIAERATFRAADVSLATNESFREVAVQRGHVPPDRSFVVRSCPDLKTLISGAPQPRLKEGKSYLVVYVGVMGPQDGVDLLLESIAHIVEQRRQHDTLFVLIGGGSESGRLKTVASEKGLDDVVKFTGPLWGDALAAYLSTAEVGVAPDPLNPMNDKSTMNKILEYMAYGIPVVLYDLAEGRRSADDAALYARPNDPADFAAQVITLLNSESLRHELGGHGRKRIEETLNWGREKAVLLEAYQKALKS
jgi:glycosyltransferase involved in cell wall biosynthesis